MTQIQTTDLNYAALLVCLGAEVDRVEHCGRYAKLHLSVPDSAIARARDKAERTQRLFDRCESVQELNVVYEQSMLFSVAEAYYNLKRRVSRERAGAN
jgi:hypothetical protein